MNTEEKFAYTLAELVFDGNRVLENLTPAMRKRTSGENVSDVLDTLVHIARMKSSEVA